MTSLEGHYFDGLRPVSVPAGLDFSSEEATLTAGTALERFTVSHLKVSPRIGSTDRFISLPNGGQFACADNAFLDSLPQESRSEGPVAWLEERWYVALASIVIVFSTLIAGYFYGLPALAERIVAHIPIQAEQSLGNQTLSWFDQNKWLKPTAIDSITRTTIRDGFEGLCKDLPSRDCYRLEFRSSQVLGPNAMALPGGIVVITDEMLKVAVSREEVLAVLAHEIGHVELRHTLRGILQNSVVGAAAALVTSDAATLSAAVVGLPMLLARTKYSREFETAADEYAFKLLRQKGYSPTAFAAIMERLAKGKEAKQAGLFAYVSSHPMTKERAERAREAATHDLEADVAKLLQGDQVLMRREINKVFSLANIYTGEGKDDKAIHLYEKALEVNASNIPMQMELASLLAKHGRMSEAVNKAHLVHELAEDGDLIHKAETLLKNAGYLENPPVPVHEVDRNVEIELIPHGDVNTRILVSLREKLEERMKISFTISPKSMEIGRPDRSYKEVVARDYIESLKKKLGDEKFSSIVSELGFRMDGLNTYENRLKFIHELFDHSGPEGQKAREIFDAKLKEAESMTQYDDARLLREIGTAFPLTQGSNLKGYLAVSSEDIYEGESRFRFGAALPGYGVMSLHRFSGEFNKEDQNRPKLVNRALKQALSSANFILGIPRCTNPNCARAYPSTLQELDQKPDTLCPLCEERLLAYRRALADQNK